MNNRSYSRGCLLWVDDELEIETLNGSANDAFWQQYFGNLDDRVYRRLGLQVALATSKEGAIQALESLRIDTGVRGNPSGAGNADKRPWRSDIFIQAVIDLTIPARSRPGEHADSKHGIDLAHFLKELGIPFHILSAQASAFETLKRERLDSVPFHPKNFDARRAVMPEPLVRTLFNEFKSNVNWIDLGGLLGRLSNDSPHPLSPSIAAAGMAPWGQYKDADSGVERPSRRFFPFFGSFRDFVERWEHRPVVTRDSVLVLRAPRFHCDEFLEQCLLLILGERIQASQNFDFCYGVLEDEASLRFGLHKAHSVRSNGAVAFRVNPDVPDSLNLFMQAWNSAPSATMIFIVPNDESAEPFLEKVGTRPNAIFDDLPLVRPGDRLAREELIRRACGFAFQQVRLDLGEGMTSPLGPIYLEHPELLAHPVNWVALMESLDIAEELSDPFEIVGIFFDAARDIERLAVSGAPGKAEASRGASRTSVREAITGDRPLPPDLLLKLAHRQLEHTETEDLPEGIPNRRRRAVPDTSRARLSEWSINAFDLWLNASWQFPYGLGEKVLRGRPYEKDFRETWEQHCLDVLVALANSLSEELLTALNDSRAEGLLLAKRFLTHDATRELIRSQGENPILQDAEFPRWPHRTYPMPAALSRYLQHSGKYLWIQSDHLDIAQGLPTGNREFHDLEAIVWLFSERIKWIQQQAGRLPLGWNEYPRLLLDIVRERSYEGALGDEGGDLLGALVGLMENAAPVSLVFHHLVTGRPLTGRGSAQERLASLHNAGPAIGAIRGIRSQVRQRVLRPARGATGEWGRCIARLASSQRLLQALRHLAGDHDVLAGMTSQTLQKMLARAADLLPEGVNANDAAVDPDLFRRFGELIESPDLNLGQDWWGLDSKSEVNAATAAMRSSGLPEAEFKSLFGTTRALFWWMLDLTQEVRFATMPFRAFDGYLLLAMLCDARLVSKNVPTVLVSRAALPVLLETFILGFEGLVAQLKFVLEQVGGDAAACAGRIELSNLEVVKPEGWVAPDPDELSAVVRWGARPEGSGLFVLGTSAAPGRFALHAGNRLLTLD